MASNVPIEIKLKLETLPAPTYATDILVLRLDRAEAWDMVDAEKLGGMRDLIRERFPDWRGKLMIIPRDAAVGWERAETPPPPGRKTVRMPPAPPGRRIG